MNILAHPFLSCFQIFYLEQISWDGIAVSQGPHLNGKCCLFILLKDLMICLSLILYITDPTTIIRFNRQK